MTTSNTTQNISSLVHQIDIKGQYINLEAPIRLSGSIDLDALLHNFDNSNGSAETVLQIGVDEAGRGPLLGDVVVAAAILPSAWSGEIEAQPLHDTPLAILTDSKKLSEKKRDLLFPLVKEHAIGFIIADVPAVVIDQVNILQATMLGMRLCSEQLVFSILQGLKEQFGSQAQILAQLKIELLFDGNRCPEIDLTSVVGLGLNEQQIDLQAWVKGDGRHTSIAAASILAKVSRDLGMYELAKQHPEFAIDKHKGYPTKTHLAAISEHGVLAEHRRSFGPVRRALEG